MGHLLALLGNLPWIAAPAALIAFSTLCWETMFPGQIGETTGMTLAWLFLICGAISILIPAARQCWNQ